MGTGQLTCTCEEAVRIAAMFFRLPKWHSTLRNFFPSSSNRNMSTFRCLKSRVRVPATHTHTQTIAAVSVLQVDRGSCPSCLSLHVRMQADLTCHLIASLPEPTPLEPQGASGRSTNGGWLGVCLIKRIEQMPYLSIKTLFFIRQEKVLL